MTAASRAATVVRLAKVVEIVLDTVGLTPNQYRMLTFVADGAPPMRELSIRLVMKPPNVTTLVDGLVARGLVRREPRADDRRRRTLSLTDEGRRLLALAESRCDDALEHLAGRAGPGAKRRRELLAGLDAWGAPLDAVALELNRGEVFAGS
jgi:DNA-binding MarR family transcriptional regulator